MPQAQPTLPTNRAFVVQFRAQPRGAPLGWEGRVEHVVSGQVTHFDSLEELLAFMRRVLTEVSAP
jgi:hypothetical protein